VLRFFLYHDANCQAISLGFRFGARGRTERKRDIYICKCDLCNCVPGFLTKLTKWRFCVFSGNPPMAAQYASGMYQANQHQHPQQTYQNHQTRGGYNCGVPSVSQNFQPTPSGYHPAPTTRHHVAPVPPPNVTMNPQQHHAYVHGYQGNVQGTQVPAFSPPNQNGLQVGQGFQVTASVPAYSPPSYSQSNAQPVNSGQFSTQVPQLRPQGGFNNPGILQNSSARMPQPGMVANPSSNSYVRPPYLSPPTAPANMFVASAPEQLPSTSEGVNLRLVPNSQLMETPVNRGGAPQLPQGTSGAARPSCNGQVASSEATLTQNMIAYRHVMENQGNQGSCPNVVPGVNAGQVPQVQPNPGQVPQVQPSGVSEQGPVTPTTSQQTSLVHSFTFP
jgi:hypothetical protein